MKRSTLIVLVICSVFLFSSLLLTPVFAADTYNWKMTSFDNAGGFINTLPKKFIEVLNERTNGAVKITLFENTLGKPQDHWEMLEKGATHLAYLSEGHNLGRVPVGTLLNLPFEISEMSLIYDLCSEWLEAGCFRELTDYFQVLFIRPTNPIHLFLRDKKVTKIDDFKGMKIRALGGMMGKTLNALGAASVSMHGSEIYMGLSTGVIDGFLTGPDFVYNFKIHEVAKYGLKLSFNVGFWGAFMNKKVWESLPKDLQDTIKAVSHDVWKEDREKTESIIKESWENLAKTKMEVYTLPPEERERWKKATSGISNEYLDEWAAKGYPVKEAYKMMQEKAKLEK
ncbi:MAG: TRAP transporter substrate-binding protein DctP [Deltaproteobacteria bacterium]|nr:TRAP transporter substrate-binding protein DctP [Deltaproteobacteria bacterium]